MTGAPRLDAHDHGRPAHADGSWLPLITGMVTSVRHIGIRAQIGPLRAGRQPVERDVHAGSGLLGAGCLNLARQYEGLSSRSFTPSVAGTVEIWFLTVPSARNSASAISRLLNSERGSRGGRSPRVCLPGSALDFLVVFASDVVDSEGEDHFGDEQQGD